MKNVCDLKAISTRDAYLLIPMVLTYTLYRTPEVPAMLADVRVHIEMFILLLHYFKDSICLVLIDGRKVGVRAELQS